MAALRFALAQRGDPYVWSEEGPDKYDCSGLMFAAYRTTAAGNFPLARVSRDQYYQTRSKSVDRYSLVPGDLLFFSSSNSWTNIHHVAMYAGSGMMVEAPRTGLNVRLVPVRWSRLFQATRIYGSVEGVTEGPDLNNPPPAGNPGARLYHSSAHHAHHAAHEPAAETAGQQPAAAAVVHTAVVAIDPAVLAAAHQQLAHPHLAAADLGWFDGADRPRQRLVG